MKKLFLLAFAAFAFAACSDDESQPTVKYDVISFETTDGLLDVDGGAVVLGTIEVVGGSAVGEHQNVYWAKGGVFDGYMESTSAGNTYDAYLCSTADQTIWFGTYYSDGTGWGAQSDNWGGFALSRNYNKTATSVNYANQFSAWVSQGALGSETCMIGYDSSCQSDSYALPTIEFTTPRTVDHLYMANSTVTYAYSHSATVSDDEYYFSVVVTGWLGGKQVGSVPCVLIQGKSKVADWVKLSLAQLGEVDRLEFKPDSNDRSGIFLSVPSYFCIDEIALVQLAK